jgi:predicted helicase
LKLKKYENVMLLKNVEKSELEKVGLSSRDMGIDILATKDEKKVAVQCKFRAKRGVTWRDIATFEALCARSGPWFEHIVMTNSGYIHREGTNIKDVNMTRSTFQKLERHEWCLLAGYGEGQRIGGGEINRDKWLQQIAVRP